MAGFNVASLAAYLKDNDGTLLANMVAKTATLASGKISLTEGIKYKQRVPFFSQTLSWQTGNCVETYSGTTTFSEKELVVTPVTHLDKYCMDDFNQKFLQNYLSPGSEQTDAAFPEAISNRLVELSAADIEKGLWQGNVVSGAATGLLNKFNGWVQKLKNTSYSSSTVSVVGTYSSGFTAFSSIAIVDDMMSVVPQNIAEEQLTLFLPMASYNTLKVALRNAYHDTILDTKIEGVNTFQMPGYSNLTVMSTPGLAGVKAAILTHSGNLAAGTDLLSDSDGVHAGYDDVKDKVYTRIKMKWGTEVFFPENVVKFFWT